MKRVVFLMLLALSPFVFSSCVPELDYPTWNIYLCFFVENNSTTPVIVEFYGQTEFIILRLFCCCRLSPL